ncbi:small glutamine-rich tetratricopeptide repeat-containing protein alpha-like [Parasteatoda tepidariorum]|uniref:small glutamine-rich tetratricopeptide repeat-containing protein alpha-like n=1 Tax=Parasteatoda tepidariorum TaxID=114398 RepID=UPI001C71A124|nr:small glutamine-rich tetratricopeptide repeat-containing protein alpha-like [Parasteatoda tepidariorum]
MSDEAENRQLVDAIVEFLRGELNSRDDLTSEDRDSLDIAIECLEIAYGLESHNPRNRRVRRPLIDVFNQIIHPPTVKDRLQAERLKNEGNEKMAEHHYAEAVAAYTQAIELDKWNAIYFCNRAGANIALQNYHDAIEDCKEALALNPDYAKAFGRMGQAYAMMEQPRKALRCFQQAVQLEPDNERYLHNLRTAESQAATIPPRTQMSQNILNSFLVTPNHQPSSGTLTIITEIAQTNSDNSSTETHQHNETLQSDLCGEAQAESETQPNNSQTQNILHLALPLILGILGHLSEDSSNENENIERRSEENFRQMNPETRLFSFAPPSETNENNANTLETSNFDSSYCNSVGADVQATNNSEIIKQESETEKPNFYHFPSIGKNETEMVEKMESPGLKATQSGTNIEKHEQKSKNASDVNRLENTGITDLEDSLQIDSDASIETTGANATSVANSEVHTHSDTPTQKNGI